MQLHDQDEWEEEAAFGEVAVAVAYVEKVAVEKQAEEWTATVEEPFQEQKQE